MLHSGYKTFHVYKDVLCQYLDGVNYNFENGTFLSALLKRCAEKHPNSYVHYEVINVRPYNAPSGKVFRNCRCVCDIRIIYKPEVSSRDHKFDTEMVADVAYTSSHRAYITGQHREIVRPVASVSSRDKIVPTDDAEFTVKGTIFSGTYDECRRYVDYVRQAPECYKNKAATCSSMWMLELRTDINGVCPTTKHTAQKMPKSAESFRRRMSGGNRYAY